MSEPTLRQDAQVDEPGLVGARWWQDSVVDPVGRRKALVTLLAVGTGVGAAGLIYEAVAPTRRARRRTIDLQREYGWSFGAATESLVFNGQSTEPFDRERLDRMAQELAPRLAKYAPFYVQTLFESPSALPKAVTEADPAPIASLKGALQPIYTPAMSEAFSRALGAADALAAPGVALIVDLEGPSAVAFAAAASRRFDPVFLFDNWPHPRGVVPAHLTLAAAAYFQPMLARAAREGGSADAPPMFVLDRQRLSTYIDSAEQFDNRWVARMPGRDALKAIGVKRLAYVTPYTSAPWELDDLNDDLVFDHAGGISIVAIPLSSLPQTAASVSPQAGVTPAPTGPLGIEYAPIPRRSPFSSGSAGGTRPVPADFGSVEVILSLLGGVLAGVAWSRSGTWNRSSGGWSGG